MPTPTWAFWIMATSFAPSPIANVMLFVWVVTSSTTWNDDVIDKNCRDRIKIVMDSEYRLMKIIVCRCLKMMGLQKLTYWCRHLIKLRSFYNNDLLPMTNVKVIESNKQGIKHLSSIWIIDKHVVCRHQLLWLIGIVIRGCFTIVNKKGKQGINVILSCGESNGLKGE